MTLHREIRLGGPLYTPPGTEFSDRPLYCTSTQAWCDYCGKGGTKSGLIEHPNFRVAYTMCYRCSRVKKRVREVEEAVKSKAFILVLRVA